MKLFYPVCVLTLQCQAETASASCRKPMIHMGGPFRSFQVLSGPFRSFAQMGGPHERPSFRGPLRIRVYIYISVFLCQKVLVFQGVTVVPLFLVFHCCLIFLSHLFSTGPVYLLPMSFSFACHPLMTRSDESKSIKQPLLENDPGHSHFGQYWKQLRAF